MNDDGKLSMEELADLNGGIKHDVAVEMGKHSKFHTIREMAEIEEKKTDELLNTGNPEKEITEDEFDKAAYNYYHGDPDAYKKL